MSILEARVSSELGGLSGEGGTYQIKPATMLIVSARIPVA